MLLRSSRLRWIFRKCAQSMYDTVFSTCPCRMSSSRVYNSSQKLFHERPRGDSLLCLLYCAACRGAWKHYSFELYPTNISCDSNKFLSVIKPSCFLYDTFVLHLLLHQWVGFQSGALKNSCMCSRLKRDFTFNSASSRLKRVVDLSEFSRFL